MSHSHFLNNLKYLCLLIFAVSIKLRTIGIFIANSDHCALKNLCIVSKKRVFLSDRQYRHSEIFINCNFN